MARIPAFDAPEIDNSFFPLTGGGKTLRGMVLNMALGRSCGNGGFPSGMPSARDMDITFSNELE